MQSRSASWHAAMKGCVALNGLHTLSLINTKVSDAGLRELRKALPGCRIIR
jgi:hypothetical protein